MNNSWNRVLSFPEWLDSPFSLWSLSIFCRNRSPFVYFSHFHYHRTFQKAKTEPPLSSCPQALQHWTHRRAPGSMETVSSISSSPAHLLFSLSVLISSSFMCSISWKFQGGWQAGEMVARTITHQASWTHAEDPVTPLGAHGNMCHVFVRRKIENAHIIMESAWITFIFITRQV